MNFEPKEIMSLKRSFNSMKKQKFYQTRFFFGTRTIASCLEKNSLKNGLMIMKNIDPQKPLFIVQRDGVHCP